MVLSSTRHPKRDALWDPVGKNLSWTAQQAVL